MWALLLGISGFLLAKENSLKKDSYGTLVAKTHSNWEIGVLLNKGSTTGDKNKYGLKQGDSESRCID